MPRRRWWTLIIAVALIVLLVGAGMLVLGWPLFSPTPTGLKGWGLGSGDWNAQLELRPWNNLKVTLINKTGQTVYDVGVKVLWGPSQTQEVLAAHTIRGGATVSGTTHLPDAVIQILLGLKTPPVTRIQWRTTPRGPSQTFQTPSGLPNGPPSGSPVGPPPKYETIPGTPVSPMPKYEPIPVSPTSPRPEPAS